MKVTIVPNDKIIIIDGKSIEFDYAISSDIHAVQWDGVEGEVEYKDINKSNEKITDFNDYLYLIDLYNLEDQRIKDEAAVTLLEEQRIKEEEVATQLEWNIPNADEIKIQAEIVRLNRIAAIQSLKDKGELPIDYSVEG